ncbi:MAG: RidA family protein [Bdellovibrionaceae bacterium]|nr:RidA family protein [Pseudobdellovibrionaceae bacterium]
MYQIINSPKAAQPIGPYSQAVEVNNFMYLSGQIPLDEKGNLVSNNIEEQTHQVFKNIENILKANHCNLTQVFKSLIFLKNMNDFSKVNSIYSQYFKKNFPARSCVEVSRLPKDVLVEIEVIAYKA